MCLTAWLFFCFCFHGNSLGLGTSSNGYALSTKIYSFARLTFNFCMIRMHIL